MTSASKISLVTWKNASLTSEFLLQNTNCGFETSATMSTSHLAVLSVHDKIRNVSVLSEVKVPPSHRKGESLNFTTWVMYVVNLNFPTVENYQS